MLSSLPIYFNKMVNRLFLKINKKKRRVINAILSDDNLKKIEAIKPIKHILHRYLPHQPLAFVYCEIANFLLNSGQPSVARNYYKLSLEAACVPSTYSLYLQCLVLDPFCNDQEMYREASGYNQFFAEVKRFQTYSNDLNPNKVLKIGYLCHFFHNCVSQSLLVPFLQAHNRQRIKVFCYSDANPDEVPAFIKNTADHWYDTKDFSDDALASLIKKNEIDVLLELNGHCFANRYGVIARKPAPIQVSYYNQAGTTGIPLLDYMFIGDEYSLDKSKSFYAESIYYLKGVSGIAVFPNDFPDCSPPPSLENHFITFGSFGAAHKVNAEVVKLWCKVLKRLPSAKFYMKAGALTHVAYLKAYQKLFEAEGISLDRVYFEGHSEHRKMLECYSKVDIALDTFPYAAGTTTMEALWQGVPVVTLSGESYGSQNGKAILTSVGHPELVAYSEEEFIYKAVELASDKERLIKYRQQLREDFRKSPRADAAAFATKLEDAYHDMWVRYCQSVQQKQVEKV